MPVSLAEKMFDTVSLSAWGHLSGLTRGWRLTYYIAVKNITFSNTPHEAL